MASSKKSSKEPPLPSQDESRRTNVLFEKLISDFRTVGESVSLLRDDVNDLKPRFDKLEQKVDVLESAVRSHTVAIQNVQTDLRHINHRVEIVEAKLA